MKRIIVALLSLAVCTLSFAKDPVKVVSGSPSVVKGKSVYVEFDNKGAVIIDEDTKKEMSIEEFCQMKGEDWIADMGKDDIEALQQINECLEKRAKSFNLTYDKSSADYIVVVRTDTFSYGNPLAFAGALMSKDVYGFYIGKFIVRTPSGDVVCEMSCDKVTADGITYTWTKQKRRVYEFVARALASTLNKAK